MANPPRNRHSKPRRDPVTIDLPPSEVKRMEEERKEADAASAATGEPEAGAPAAGAAAVAGTAPENAREGAEPGAKPTEAAAEETTAEASGNPPEVGAVPSARSTDNDSTSDPKRRPGGGRVWAGAIGGGVIGAVLAVGGAAALQWYGYLPVPQGDVAALRQEVEALRSNPPQIGDQSRAAIDNARQTAASAQNEAQAAQKSVAQLKDQLASLDKSVGAIRQSANPASAGDVQSLQNRLSQLEQKVSALAQNPAPAPAMQQSVQQLSNELQALSGKVSNLAESVQQTASAASRDSNALSGNSAEIASLKSAVGTLQQKVAQSASQPRIARAIAASALKAAVDRGGTFATELRTYAAVAPNSPELAQLKPLAEKGVPTLGELQARFNAVADQIIAATRPADRNAGFFDQIVDSARSLVSVRPVGMVAGTTPSAIVARMEAALNAGDLGRALSEWNSLPAEAKSVSKDFADSLRARQEADRLVAQALADALEPGSGSSATSGAAGEGASSTGEPNSAGAGPADTGNGNTDGTAGAPASGGSQ